MTGSLSLCKVLFVDLVIPAHLKYHSGCDRRMVYLPCHPALFCLLGMSSAIVF